MDNVVLDCTSELSFNENEEGQNENNSYEAYGWKSLLLLQFQPQFEGVLMMGIFATYIFVLVDFTFVFSCDISNIINEYTATGMSYIYCVDLLYLVDIVSMISYKSTQWDEVKLFYAPRCNVMLIVDVVSVVPFDAVYSSLTEPNMKVLYTLRLRYVLRMIRFVHKVTGLNRVFDRKYTAIMLLQTYIISALSIFTTACALFYIDCVYEHLCNYQDSKKFIFKAYTVFASITSVGYDTHLPVNFYHFLIHSCVGLIFFLCVRGFGLGLFLISNVNRGTPPQLYGNIKNVSLREITEYGMKNTILYRLTENAFDLNRNARTIAANRYKIKIPRAMLQEMWLEIYWDAMKHSHLFRDKEVTFLRYVAPFMKRVNGIPGEPIFQRNAVKSAMFYVSSGVIQVLSVEDGETPILSFSGGTCIGESTLIISYRSSCNVVCKSYCCLNVLYKKDFIKLQQKYPEILFLMLGNINQRYKEAQENSKLLEITYSSSKKKRNLLNLTWLKAIMSDLSNRKVSSGLGKGTEDLKKRELFKEHYFCPFYLDLLVKSDDVELVNDSVFIKATCPCILQPDSVIVIVWDYFISYSVLTLMYIYPYYAIFEPVPTLWFLVFLHFVTCLWLLDIYVKVSTAIKTEDGTITSVSQIASKLCQDVKFIMDIFSVVPLELFATLLVVDISYQGYILLHMLKLLKMYRIPNVFKSSKIRFLHSGVPIQHVVYYTLVLLWVAAFSYIIICYDNVCMENHIIIEYFKHVEADTNFQRMVVMLYLTTFEQTFIGVVIPAIGEEHLSSWQILWDLCAAICIVYLQARAFSFATIKSFDKFRISEYASHLLQTMKTLNVSVKLQKCASNYIRGQIKFNNCTNILYQRRLLRKFNFARLNTEIRYDAFMDVLNRQPLFQGLPEEFLADVASLFELSIFGPNTVLTYSGEVCKNMYIILDGYCIVIQGSDRSMTTMVSTDSCYSGLEMWFELPVINTLITLTHVRFITINRLDFMTVLRKYPAILLDFVSATKEVYKSEYLVIDSIIKHQNLGMITTAVERQVTSSFKYFGYKLDKDSARGVDYHQYFDQLQYFNFLRYVPIRCVIYPDGVFILYWEVIRCIFAFVTLLICPITFINHCTDCTLNYIFLFLDSTAWVDIIIRHNIGYFNKKGILITHPIKTIIHYWTHSFIIDFLGCFPFELLVRSYFNLGHNWVFFKYFRLLQVYRILKGILYLENHIITSSRLWTNLKYLPFIVLIINFVASVVTNLCCTFDSSIEASKTFSEGVSCKPQCSISQSPYAKPLSWLRVYLYEVLYVVGVLIRPSCSWIVISNFVEIISATVMATIAFSCFVFISSTVIPINLFRNADLAVYQVAMKNLVKFMSYRNIDRMLKLEIIHHFEYVWNLYKGKNLQKMVSKLHSSLQEDILFDIYGKILVDSGIFKNAYCSFFRCLLLIAEHEVFIKRGIICRVNDVHNKIYIVFKGQVDVLGPDYNRLILLPVGSMFGSLDNCSMKRQTLTMVAKGHVELLTIDSIQFHQILSTYHQLKSHFRRLTAINSDYLVSNSYKEDDKLSSFLTVSEISAGTESSFISSSLYSSKMSGRLILLNIWNHVIVCIAGYVSPALELYAMVMYDYPLLMILLLYLFDLICIINIIVQFHMPYENNFGILVRDRKNIALRYMKQGFCIDFVSVVPLELICLFFLNKNYMWRVWSFCRLNRFFRIHSIIIYFYSNYHKLHVNIFFMWSSILFTSLLMILHVLTCIQIGLCCAFPGNNINPVLSCNWKTSTEKFMVYIQQFSVVIYLFTMTTPTEYFPNSLTLICYNIFLLLVCRVLNIFLLSEMCAIVDIMLHHKLLYMNAVHYLRNFMLSEKISPSLINRLFTYARMLWICKSGEQFPKLLNDAPYYLREAVLNAMFGYHLRRHPKLKLCHVDLLRQIVAKLHASHYLPGDYIRHIGDVNNCMYFVHEGLVQALSEDDILGEKVEQTIKAGEMFGFDQGLYPHCGHEYTYKAKIFTLLLILNRDDWIHLLDFFPASRELIYDKEKEKKILRQKFLGVMNR